MIGDGSDRTSATSRDGQTDSDNAGIAPELVGLVNTPCNNGAHDVTPAVAPAPIAGDRDIKATTRSNWVPVHRYFLQEDWWRLEHERWDSAHLYLHLYARANIKPESTLYHGRHVAVGRGCICTSITALAALTHWDRKTVRRFLNERTAAGLLRLQYMGQFGVLITFCKYDDYAFPYEQEGQQTGQKVKQHTGQITLHRRAKRRPSNSTHLDK